jgi:hypothetical protein
MITQSLTIAGDFNHWFVIENENVHFWNLLETG